MDIHFNQDMGGGGETGWYEISHMWFHNVAIKIYIPVNFWPLPLFSKLILEKNEFKRTKKSRQYILILKNFTVHYK